MCASCSAICDSLAAVTPGAMGTPGFQALGANVVTQQEEPRVPGEVPGSGMGQEIPAT